MLRNTTAPQSAKQNRTTYHALENQLPDARTKTPGINRVHTVGDRLLLGLGRCLANCQYYRPAKLSCHQTALLFR